MSEVNGTNLEQRLAELERRVAQLETTQAKGHSEQDWRRTVGMFSGDDGMKEIVDAALAYREADRERARKHYARLDEAKARRKAKQKKKA